MRTQKTTEKKDKWARWSPKVGGFTLSLKRGYTQATELCKGEGGVEANQTSSLREELSQADMGDTKYPWTAGVTVIGVVSAVTC